MTSFVGLQANVVLQECETYRYPYDHNCADFETVGIECSGDGSRCVGPTAVYAKPPFDWGPLRVVFLVIVGLCCGCCACWPESFCDCCGPPGTKPPRGLWYCFVEVPVRFACAQWVELRDCCRARKARNDEKRERKKREKQERAEKRGKKEEEEKEEQAAREAEQAKAGAPTVTLTARELTGKTVTISSLTTLHTVAELKAAVAAATGGKAELLRLVFKNSPLEAGSTLGSCGLAEGSEVTVVAKTAGEGAPPGPLPPLVLLPHQTKQPAP
eukprot:COSAG04_NODE_2870_length_3441_cov_13.335428_2_plen_271_part_00